MKYQSHLGSTLLPAGIRAGEVKHNLTVEALVHDTLSAGLGVITDSGALAVNTGKFTGRTPEDKYLVKDALTENTVWWGEVNKPMEEDTFYKLLAKMSDFCLGAKLYVQDVFACADVERRISVRVITNSAYHAQFVANMFITPSESEKTNFKTDYTVFCLPDFVADPTTDGTRSPNFVSLNLSKHMILIGGTAYTGEIKKSIFSVLNFILPRVGVLSMHCSANVDHDGKTTVFFGLSGTGKTTLSADGSKMLVGDDEHGWTDKGIFNFEGGCYAKVINLSKENEPMIWNAIKPGALLENICFVGDSNVPDYKNDSISANTRVSYDLTHIENALIPSVASHPANIIFLTADAWGILPPISLLSPEQAMFHFVSGYTAKIAGTEAGITEPKSVFSACFGAPFLPLHPLEYAKLLGEKMKAHETKVWLVNTGWTGGAYGEGKRISIPYTRALIDAAIGGTIAEDSMRVDPVFKFLVPSAVTGVPTEILNPRNTWTSKEAYDKRANSLASAFLANIEKYKTGSNLNIMAGAPVLIEEIFA